MAANNSTGEATHVIDPRTLAILLLILGLILIAIEAATPGFFIAVPGTIFLILGILGIIAPEIYSMWYTPIIVIIVLVVASAATIKFYQMLVGKPEPTIATTTLSMVGKEGIVIKKTDPDDPTKGRVRIAGEDWAATSDVPLPPGTRVVVVGGEGVHLKVKKKE